ncbi:MAG TPA: efflux RND transporter periplasmic adaptor subunit [Candidatus Limnocylindrales bacterium]|nr:efflux RND transporter periplasmic adaptor subunit [Candidatus Limnocylindrales bacterium]
MTVLKKRGWIIFVCLVLLALAGGGTWLFGMRHGAGSVSAAAGIPSSEVIRGELVDTIELRGEIKPARSVDLVAPSDSGDIQILKLSKDGTMVKKGESVVILDPTTIQNTLNQRKSDLRQAEAQVEDAKAKAKLAEEGDLTLLQKSKYDVERAKLDASQSEILSVIDGQEKRLSLADAEQAEKQAQQKVDSDRASSKSDIANIDQKRQKALRDVQHYEDAISKLTLNAPVDGMVHLMRNWRAGGVFGDNAPPYKEGDRAYALAAIAQLPDLSSLRIVAHLEEEDRGRLMLGNTVSARVDAVPDKEFIGQVSSISPLAKIDFSGGWPPAKNFDMTVVLDHPDPRLRPGMSATERIAVQRIPNIVLVPSEAIFTRNGRDVVYVQQGSKFGDSFEERSVVTGHHGGGQVEVKSGVKPGERVALKDPVAKP